MEREKTFSHTVYTLNHIKENSSNPPAPVRMHILLALLREAVCWLVGGGGEGETAWAD